MAPIMAYGLTVMFVPTSVDLVGGLAIANAGRDKWLRFIWLAFPGLQAVPIGIVAFTAEG
jgi:uncharacterized ion transporter superfamily protein YfcC